MTEMPAWVAAAAIAYAPDEVGDALADLWVPQLPNLQRDWDLLGGRSPRSVSQLSTLWLWHIAAHARDLDRVWDAINTGRPGVAAYACLNPHADQELVAWLQKERRERGPSQQQLERNGFLPRPSGPGYDPQIVRRALKALRHAAIRVDLEPEDVVYSWEWSQIGPLGPAVSEWLYQNLDWEHDSTQHHQWALRMAEPWRTMTIQKVRKATGTTTADLADLGSLMLRAAYTGEHLRCFTVDLLNVIGIDPAWYRSSPWVVRNVVWAEAGVDVSAPIAAEQVPQVKEIARRLPNEGQAIVEQICRIVEGGPLVTDEADRQHITNFWAPEFTLLERHQLAGLTRNDILDLIYSHPDIPVAIGSLGGPYEVLVLSERWDVAPQDRLELIDQPHSEPAAYITTILNWGLEPPDHRGSSLGRVGTAYEETVPGRAGDEWVDRLVYERCFETHTLPTGYRPDTGSDAWAERFLQIPKERVFGWLDEKTTASFDPVEAEEHLHRRVGEWLADRLGGDLGAYVDFGTLYGRWEQPLGGLCRLVRR